MKTLFNLDNPFMQALARIGDLMLLSVITLVCCLPVITIGPALTALNKTVYSLTLETCGSTVGTYYRAFRANLKQSLILGLAITVAIAAFFCDFILLRLYFAGTAYQVLLFLVAALTFLVLCLASYLFPLVGRYENTLSEHLRNAAILMIVNFPRTLLMVFLHLLPILMLYINPEFLVQTLVLWIFLAPGLMAQFDAYILRPVFEGLEKADHASGEAKPEDDGE